MNGPRFSVIPAGAVFDRSLEPRDLHVIGLLGCYTDKLGWCRRSQVKMARQLNCGRSSVQRSLDRLVEAGWVEKKQQPGANEDGQPSNSYMYRVILDRDDFSIIESDDGDADEGSSESHAEIASEEGNCPPVGTPGAQQDGHPGAQPYVGTGAQPYVGTKNVPLERPLIERERDARAKDRKARFLVSFEARWPTSASDDRQRTAYAAEALTEPEEEAALAGIGPFLENHKRIGRKHVPAGWNYLEQKRWSLLEAQKAADGASAPTNFARDSTETKAIIVLHDLAGRGEALRKIYRRADGSIDFRKPMTPQLAALADAPGPADWAVLERQQAAAWERFLEQFFEAGVVRTRMREGLRAPWPWPPRKDGTLSPTGDTLMSQQDYEDFH